MEGSKKLMGYLVNKTTSLLKFTEDNPDSPSDELANVYAEKCWVCGVPFSMLKGVLRYHCGFCANSVCSDHSQKRRAKVGTSEVVRICDTCESDFIRALIEATMQEELRTLQSTLDSIRYENELMTEADTRLSQTLLKLQKKHLALTEAQSNTLSGLKTKLEDERQADKEQVSEIDRLYALSEVARSEEIACRAKLESVTLTLGTLEESVRELKGLVGSSRQTLESMETETGSVPVKELRGLLCAECEEGVMMALK